MINIYLLEALYEKAEAEFLNKKYTETIELLDTTLEYLNNSQKPLIGKIYMLQARTHLAMAQFRDAQSSCRKALNYYLDNNIIRKAAQAYRLTGKIEFNQGNYDRAISSYEKALDLLPVHSINPKVMKLKAKIHISIGEVAQRFRQIKLEKRHFARAIFLSKKLDNKQLIGRSILGIGVYFFHKGKYDKSQRALFKGIQLLNEIDCKEGLAYGLHFLGQLYIKKEKYRKSVSALRYSFSLFEKTSNKIQQASTLTYLAEIFLNFDSTLTNKLCIEATDLLISQPSFNSKHHSEVILGRIYVIMGQYYNQKKEYGLARTSLKEGLEIFDIYNYHSEYHQAYEIYQDIPIEECTTYTNKPDAHNTLAYKLGLIS